MSTVGEVVDRTLAHWLLPADDQPIVLSLSATIDADDTSLTYVDSTLAPDEEDLLAPGVLVELDSELCRITDVDQEANTLTLIRGVSGTAATSHNADTPIYVAPLFPRSAIVEAVKDNVVALYPSLWHIATEELTSDSSYVEVPVEAVTPKKLVWQNGNYYRTAPLPDLLTDFPPSSTNTAIQLNAVPEGHTIYFTYEAKFSRPDTEATELFDLGVADHWERIIEVGAAAQVVASRPQDRLSAEFITEQLERESLPPGTATDARNGLLTLRSIFMDEAHRQLVANQTTPVVYAPAPAVRR